MRINSHHVGPILNDSNNIDIEYSNANIDNFNNANAFNYNAINSNTCNALLITNEAV